MYLVDFNILEFGILNIRNAIFPKRITSGTHAQAYAHIELSMRVCARAGVKVRVRVGVRVAAVVVVHASVLQLIGAACFSNCR